ncbi:MAG TPA: hypothetical protein VNL70_09510 [Tepidisphaeraceae bacterium]|nr:hypothetical protein [Tepidisphaeraceae bacterium]
MNDSRTGRWLARLLLTIVLAGLTFGGTFTCNYNDDDDDRRPGTTQTSARK